MAGKKVKDKEGIIRYINRRTYNTNISKVVAEWSESKVWKESLYIKRGGELFILGIGVAAPAGIVTPLSHDDAAVWMKERIGQSLEDAIAAVNEKTSIINVEVPASLKIKVEKMARDRNMSIRRVMLEAVKAGIDVM